MDLSILKDALREALSKNISFVADDAVQYLDTHYSTLKYKTKKTKKISQRPEAREFSFPSLDEEPFLPSQEGMGVWEGRSEEPFDCPPATWEDIGVWDEEPEEAPVDESDALRLEEALPSCPSTIDDQSFADSLYEDMD